ncbi:hypothetical protein [Paenibacillus vini]|uniref:hypothetical protein n=1 Tax=Paenibacillus vini TaxID=1476024 RepID=UPI00338FA5BA
MARRKSNAKQQEEFIQALFGLLVFASIFGTFGLTKSFQATIIVTGLAVPCVHCCAYHDWYEAHGTLKAIRDCRHR